MGSNCARCSPDCHISRNSHPNTKSASYPTTATAHAMPRGELQSVGYNFTPGNYIYSPPGNFCSYFNCIPSFWTHTNGYVEECSDGTYSHSGGVQGSCSYHGGNWRPLYSH